MSDATVLVIGEALTDVVIGADGAEQARPGGNPASIAVELAQLGVATDRLCRIGPDAHGTEEDGWARTALRSAALTVGRHGAQPPHLADLQAGTVA